MKKIFIVLGAVAMVAACGSEDTGTGACVIFGTLTTCSENISQAECLAGSFIGALNVTTEFYLNETCAQQGF